MYDHQTEAELRKMLITVGLQLQVVNKIHKKPWLSHTSSNLTDEIISDLQNVGLLHDGQYQNGNRPRRQDIGRYRLLLMLRKELLEDILNPNSGLSEEDRTKDADRALVPIRIE